MKSSTGFLRSKAFAIAILALIAFPCAAQEPSGFPATPKHPVADEYHGVKVIDDYRWLEDANDPAVKSWVAAQNKFSRSMLDANPARSVIASHLKQIYSNEPVAYYSFYNRKMFFALKSQPPKDQPLLVMMKSPEDRQSEKVILDLNVLNPKGTTAIDFYVPSLDGRLVAVSLSENGSEDGSVHVYETATGKALSDVIPRVNFPTGGGNVAWNADATGFYYTRYPQGDERPKEDINFYQQVYFHKLGTPASADTYVIGKEFPRIAEITFSTTVDGKYLLVNVANGDGGEFAHYLRTPSGAWTQITHFEDGVKAARFGLNDTLYLLSVKGSPHGKVLALPLSESDLSRAKVIVPESDATIEYVVPARTRMYVGTMLGGPSEIRVYDLNGKQLKPIPTKPVSSTGVGVRLEGDDILFYSESFVDPFSWFQLDAASNKISKTQLAAASAVNFDDAEVVRDFAISKDGTKVPINIIKRKDTKLDGNNPTILYGYGGYGINTTPFFWSRNRIWLDAGGVYAFANIRGGGEYGEEWHQGGNLTRKQNVFDDFIACAQYLISRKYTSPSKFAIEGGSNGGLLMGAALTQHPELFRAVISYVGIYDMLRVELSPNGSFNVTEFGTVKDPDQFKALYAYSPLHNVKDNTTYPAVLMMTGDNDGRVDPMQSRKMTARLQAATNSKLPVLLRTSSDTGHGIGTGLSTRIAEETDVFAFLFDELRINAKP
jgi:prolyl oligopeptidase